MIESIFDMMEIIRTMLVSASLSFFPQCYKWLIPLCRQHLELFKVYEP